MRLTNTVFFKRFYLFIFRQRGWQGEREGETHQCVVASSVPSTWDLTHNPGMCPDWESNQHPFVSQAGIQYTEPHQQGQVLRYHLLTNISPLFCFDFY